MESKYQFLQKQQEQDSVGAYDPHKSNFLSNFGPTSDAVVDYTNKLKD